jgi:hypothetical protein
VTDPIGHLSETDRRLAKAWLGVPEDRIAACGPARGLIVGEAPGPNTSGRLPMFPWPVTSAAGRLLRISGLSPAEYLGRFERRNLLGTCPDRWPTLTARVVAPDVLRQAADGRDRPLRVVLLGARVAEAFRMGLWESRVLPWVSDGGAVEVEVRTIGHPSGLNPIYNHPLARLAAQAVMVWAGGWSD